MMKYFKRDSTFAQNWESVAAVFWKRYPNPYSKHVTSEDITFRRILKNGFLYSRRLLTKTNRLPKWGERFTSVRAVPVLEESLIDPARRTIVTYTRNLSYQKVMSIDEKCTYRPDPDSPADKTVVSREAWISSELRGFSHLLVRFALERFKKNASHADKGIVYTLVNHSTGSSDTTQQASSVPLKNMTSSSSKIIKTQRLAI